MEFDLFIIPVKAAWLTTGTSESCAGEIASSNDVKQTCQKDEASLAAQAQGTFLKAGLLAAPPWG